MDSPPATPDPSARHEPGPPARGAGSDSACQVMLRLTRYETLRQYRQCMGCEVLGERQQVTRCDYLTTGVARASVRDAQSLSQQSGRRDAALAAVLMLGGCAAASSHQELSRNRRRADEAPDTQASGPDLVARLQVARDIAQKAQAEKALTLTTAHHRSTTYADRSMDPVHRAGLAPPEGSVSSASFVILA